jgi:hypothetical protein
MSAAAAHVGAAGTLVLAPQQASTSGSIAPAVSITGEHAHSHTRRSLLYPNSTSACSVVRFLLCSM